MSQNPQCALNELGETDEETESKYVEPIELRKPSKDAQLSKRQNIVSKGPEDPCTSSSLEASNSGREGISGLLVNEAIFKELVADVFGDDPEKRFAATQRARMILSREKNPPIDMIISAGIVPRLIQFLKEDKYPDLQFEAAWILTNIASGNKDQTNSLVEAGAVEPFIDLLSSSSCINAEQAVWALGNISGDGPDMRDYVLSKGIVPPLVALAQSSDSPTLLRNVAWAFSNLSRGIPPPPQDALRPCFPALARLIGMKKNMDVVGDACWALLYLSDGPDEKIEEVVKAGFVPKLVELLECDCETVLTPCIRAVGNIVTGTDSQTQCVVEAGVLQKLKKLLTSTNGGIVKDAAWIVSNIAAGTDDQILEILKADLVPLLVEVLESGEFRAQKEAVYALCNIASRGNVIHINFLCLNGAIPAMCQILRCKDCKTILTALDGLENILKAVKEAGEEEMEKVSLAIEECGGLDVIEQLQDHENMEVYNTAFHIIETFFCDEGATDDDNLLQFTPSTTANGDFQMSATNVPEGGFNI